MSTFEQQRRSMLVGLGGLGIGQLLTAVLDAEQAARSGSVLGPAGGEHLVHFRDGGDIFIKFGTATGSRDLAMGTQQVKVATGIPVHRHPGTDEAFWILDGAGVVVLDDVRQPFEKGGTVFIPRNTWHGFENPSHELLLLWVVTPAGLDNFFRDTCSPPGTSGKALTRDQIRQIALKHGTEFR